MELRPATVLELIWEQEAPGSNPGIPTKSQVMDMLLSDARLPRSSDRHLTVKLNGNRRHRLSRVDAAQHRGEACARSC